MIIVRFRKFKWAESKLPTSYVIVTVARAYSSSFKLAFSMVWPNFPGKIVGSKAQMLLTSFDWPTDQPTERAKGQAQSTSMYSDANSFNEEHNRRPQTAPNMFWVVAKQHPTRSPTAIVKIFGSTVLDIFSIVICYIRFAIFNPKNISRRIISG